MRAENNIIDDSVKVKFPEVQVNADRILSDRALLYSPVSEIDLEDIRRIGAMQVSDAISNSPGVFIRNYGGLGGMKTISLRGTGSAQTLIMLDGVKINSSQNGLVDLSIFPISELNSIEIVRGGTSALFGGNAIGGVVNLRTKIRNDYFLTGKLSRGSFDEWNGAIGFTLPYNNLSPDLSKGEGGYGTMVQGNCEYTKSGGNYPFNTNQFGENIVLHRDNADFENFNAALIGETEINNWSLNSKLFYRSSVRGTPGTVVQGNIESSNARLNERELLFITQSKKQLNATESLLINFSARLNRINYNDSTAFGSINPGINNTFFNKDIMLSGKLNCKFGKILSDFNIETGFSDLNGDMLQADVGRYVIRKFLAISNLEETDFSFVNYLNVSLQGGARLDVISNIGAALSPIFGMIISSTQIPLRLRSQWSYNFRPPSFNEMYYLNYGTSELKPERSNSYNLGLSWLPFENTYFETEGFIILTKDQIVSVPKSPVTWSAQNIGNVLTKGFELSLNSKLFDKLFEINLSYTRQVATDETKGAITYSKQIAYVPQEIISGIASVNNNSISIGMVMQYSSYYYCLPDNNFASINPSFATLNLFASEKLKISNSSFIFRFDCNNLFDVQYSIIKNYPMPGRSLRVSMSFEI